MAREGMIDREDQITLCTTSSSESEKHDSRTYIYGDESVLMDCDMPELVVFLQESKHRAIEDFCTDGEVPSLDKSLMENYGLDHHIVSRLLNSDVDRSEQIPNTHSSISNDSDSFIQRECEDYVVEQCGFRNLVKKIDVDFDARDQVSIEGSTERNTPEWQLLVGEMDTNYRHSELSKPIGYGCGQRSYQGPIEEAVLGNSMLSSATEEINSSCHAIESGSITLDIDSSMATISGREEEEPLAIDSQQGFETENILRLEDDVSGSLTVSTRSFVIQNGNGESSFSAFVPLSDHIEYSGSIPYSGSTSLRSNSSTASTQSFAFPILHSEWNGSPVKMIEPQRSHSRKYRSWRFYCLCCKF